MRIPFILVTTLLGCQVALAQPAARSLDGALVDTLALGRANGCGTAFGVPDFGFDQTALDTYLLGERNAGRLGKEITAICGSSAVASAASLGGSLGSVQATKTVSQFRAARNRADSRLNPRGQRAEFGRPVLLAQAGGAAVGAFELGAADRTDPAAFLQIDHEARKRSTTALEAGYRAGTTEVALGLDFALPGEWFAGTWLGWRSTAADYRNPGLLLGGNDNGFGASLDAATRAQICRTGPGGGFDDDGLRLGAFAARRMGPGFVDAGLQFSRRNYRYTRAVCAIEANAGRLVADANSPSGFSSDGVTIDDVYAGTIAAKARLTEWAATARAGLDFGDPQAFTWGPRLGLTYARTAIGSYTESGRTSVTHTVTSNTGLLQTLRAAGDPTGLELTFDGQSRSSLQSELQFVAALRMDTAAGSLTPRLALSWVHEFRTDAQVIQVRMAQDRRAAPTTFSFTRDALDANKGVAALGVRWERGADMAADLEIRRQFGDPLFAVTSVGLRGLWRF